MNLDIALVRNLHIYAHIYTRKCACIYAYMNKTTCSNKQLSAKENSEDHSLLDLVS